jgi:methionine-rich copper-binding protein CopC
MRRTILLAVAMTALGVTQAAAHARLIQATPRVGSTVSVSPRELRLFFSESIAPAQSSVSLSARDGRAVTLGPLSLNAKDHRVVVVALPTTLPSGRYRVAWSMTSTDAHQTYGDFTFNLRP